MTFPMSERAADELDDFGIGSGRFPHPFNEDTHYDYYGWDEEDPTDRDTPRTLIELRMCALSAAMREKANWHVKFRDEKIRSKWVEEIREQQKDLHQSLQLTDNMVRHYLSAEMVGIHVSHRFTTS